MDGYGYFINTKNKCVSLSFYNSLKTKKYYSPRWLDEFKKKTTKFALFIFKYLINRERG